MNKNSKVNNNFLLLDVALDSDECEGDLLLGDMGNGMPFRAGTFDGAIRFFLNKRQRYIMNYFSLIYYLLKYFSSSMVMQCWQEISQSN